LEKLLFLQFMLTL